MTPRVYSLVPFSSAEAPPDIRISGTLLRQAGTLTVGYRIEGDLGSLLIPEPVMAPCRRDGLWRETCLELFLTQATGGPYWELNLSPAGHWNVYRFSGYREGMREEAAVGMLVVGSNRDRNLLALSAELDLDGIDLGTHPLCVGLSAVVRSAHETVSYWALTHPGPKPDFHRRESFLIQI